MALRITPKAEWPAWVAERYGDTEDFMLVDGFELDGQSAYLPMANFSDWDEDRVLQYAEEFIARRLEERAA